MRIASLLFFSLLLLNTPKAADGMTLDEALVKTLENNLTLKAGMYKSLGSKREIVGSAVGGILPQIEYTLSIVKQGAGDVTKLSVVTLTQPMFNGAAMVNLDKARYLHRVQDTSFYLERQQILLATIATYMGVLSASGVDKLNENNVMVMREHLAAAEQRFSVGEITKTDLAKAKAKFAQAKSEAVSAKSKLKAVMTSYVNLVGEEATGLEYPKRKLQIPGSLEEAIELAMSNNLSLNISKDLYQASKRDLTIAIAKKLLPSLSVQAKESFLGNNLRRGTHQFNVQLHAPIFEHGVGFINIDRAYKARQQSFFSMHETVKSVEASVINAWEELIASRVVLQAARESVKYTEVVLEAITKEFELDLKTTLDVLNVEQELLKAKVNLINAQSNLIVNQYNLLAATGQFI